MKSFEIAGSPQLPPASTVPRVMRDVLIALVPGIAAHLWFFGPGLLIQIALACACALALEAAMREHQPRVFFTQPRLQSPTNSIASGAQLYRVLQLAEPDFRAGGIGDLAGDFIRRGAQHRHALRPIANDRVVGVGCPGRGEHFNGASLKRLHRHFAGAA